MTSRFKLVVVCMLLPACASVTNEARTGLQITTSDYAAAERLISHHIGNAVRNDRIVMNWLDEGAALSYRRDGLNGPEHIRVSTSTGSCWDRCAPTRCSPRAVRHTTVLADDGQAPTIIQP